MFGISMQRSKPAPVDPAVEIAHRARLEQRINSVGGPSKARSYNLLREHHRAHDREAVYRVATAIFSPESAVSCRVVNKSFSGMRLSFPADFDIPEEFGLTIPTLRFIGVVRTVWRNEREAGVSIIRWSEGAE